MNARPLLIAGLALGSSLVLSACTTTAVPGHISAAADAHDCLDKAGAYMGLDGKPNPDNIGRAPEVLTYDPNSRVETSLDSRGGAKVLVVQNRSDVSRPTVTALAVDEATGDDDRICSADGRGRNYVSYRRSGPNPVVIGTIAGAIVGGAMTKNGSGAATGAVYGGSFGAALQDQPYAANSISIGAALGSLVGYSVSGTQGAGAGAAYGALLGAQTNTAGGATLRSDGRASGAKGGSGGRGGR